MRFPLTGSGGCWGNKGGWALTILRGARISELFPNRCVNKGGSRYAPAKEGGVIFYQDACRYAPVKWRFNLATNQLLLQV